MYGRTIFNSRKATPQQLDEYRRSVCGVPPDAEVLTREADGVTLQAVLYRWTTTIGGRAATMLAAFSGKRTKPDLYEWSRDETRSSRAIDDYFRGVAAHARYGAERRAAHRNVDMSRYVVGTILHASGGYDMTRNDYYQVVAVKGRSIVLRRITSEVVDGHGGYTGRERPIADAFVGDEELTRRVTANGVKVDGYKHAHVWSGQPNYFNYMD